MNLNMVPKVLRRELIHTQTCIRAVSRRCGRNHGAAGMIELLGKENYSQHVCAESDLTIEQADLKYLR